MILFIPDPIVYIFIYWPKLCYAFWEHVTLLERSGLQGNLKKTIFKKNKYVNYKNIFKFMIIYDGKIGIYILNKKFNEFWIKF